MNMIERQIDRITQFDRVSKSKTCQKQNQGSMLVIFNEEGKLAKICTRLFDPLRPSQ